VIKSYDSAVKDLIKVRKDQMVQYKPKQSGAASGSKFFKEDAIIIYDAVKSFIYHGVDEAAQPKSNKKKVVAMKAAVELNFGFGRKRKAETDLSLEESPKRKRRVASPDAIDIDNHAEADDATEVRNISTNLSRPSNPSRIDAFGKCPLPTSSKMRPFWDGR
jgi:hypothetical protein